MKGIIYFVISGVVFLAITHLISPDYNNQLRHIEKSERVN
jgi:hypothetical protein